MLAASFGESKGSPADRPTLCSVEWRRDNLKAAALLPPKDKSALFVVVGILLILRFNLFPVDTTVSLELKGRFSPRVSYNLVYQKLEYICEQKYNWEVVNEL